MRIRELFEHTQEDDELFKILTNKQRRADAESYWQIDYDRTKEFLRTHLLSEISDRLILAINQRYVNIIYRKWNDEQTNLSDELIINLIKQQPGEFEIMMENKGFIPSEAVQLMAVKKLGKAIFYIIQKGIIPSEAVQQAAVRAFGYPIKYIVAGGITPSDTVIQLAITKDPDLIRSIPNPSDEYIQAALMNPKLINNEALYNRALKKYFRNNELMMRKWTRYGDRMRNQ